MVIGVGIDLLEISRLEEALGRHGEAFERKIFTSKELADCATRKDRIQALAARFAAKEACLKAFGTGQHEGLSLRHVEVVRTENGAPRLRLHGRAEEKARELGVTRTHV